MNIEHLKEISGAIATLKTNSAYGYVLEFIENKIREVETDIFEKLEPGRSVPMYSMVDLLAMRRKTMKEMLWVVDEMLSFMDQKVVEVSITPSLQEMSDFNLEVEK